MREDLSNVLRANFKKKVVALETHMNVLFCSIDGRGYRIEISRDEAYSINVKKKERRPAGAPAYLFQN
ncbi:MAG: hypothetical protein COA82_12290 [Alkaliphilus sp.]|jgi:hypothetical protein|nr:hypothetical protein [Alkaliphilus transvaalensis]MBN4069888.1 hypothetical protein [bacterium AH-315-G05]PHS29774.1 MAG: hypothetical protein COA82_12290 [Alkaliphilus sp.]